METITATEMFWFIALGLALGWIFGKVVKSEGVSLISNVIWGVTAAVITGSMGIIFAMGDGLPFAFVGTLAFLFIVNVFHLHHQEDLFDDVDPKIRITKVQ